MVDTIEFLKVRKQHVVIFTKGGACIESEIYYSDNCIARLICDRSDTDTDTDTDYLSISIVSIDAIEVIKYDRKNKQN